MSKLIIEISIICLVLQAIAQLIGKIELKRILLSTLLCLTATIQYVFYITYTKELLLHPKLVMSYVPLLLSLGPLMRLYFNQLSKDSIIFKTTNISHILLPISGLIYYSKFAMTPLNEILPLINNLYLGHASKQFYMISSICTLSLLFYALLILKEQPAFWKQDQLLNKPLLLGWSILNILFIFIMGLSIFNTTLTLITTHIGNTLVSIVFICIFIVNNRYPDLFQKWLFEVRKKHRTRQYLGDINPHEMLNKIHQTMKNDKLYTDPNVSLQSLADHFKLTRYQLSELLNDYAKQSFSDFIGYFRVELAKELLLKDSWKKTITIGLEVGFNSQAMFNKTFKKWTEKTPSEYQKSFA